ncbi:GNAT family N-acetyltransferase [Pseudomonas sp. NY15435]|uniref:GNAT family N-acetyltransferase n=1 Tax=Pseudomonas sp. NY15435 TaxID=3400358 RepID=UPI003A895DDE
MRLSTLHQCPDFDSYRAARVKSLFNVEAGNQVEVQADLPIEDMAWQIGVIVGPSGSGKTTLGRAIGDLYAPDWPARKPIIDAIAPDGSFDAVTSALSAVGLGSVPAWLRPFPVLSNGEQFRANLARLVCEAPELAVVDEFSSVVDRQIARIGAGAFAKAWRRTGGRAVLLSCHYDILDWVQPDWVYDTASGQFHRGWHRPRPRFDLEIRESRQRDYALFEPHHYLKLPPMVAASHYTGWVDGEPVAHIAFSTRPGLIEARACRLVVMPEWQGAGVGMRFLNALCARWLEGENRYQKPLRTLFHTSHPGLAAALRRDRHWTQVSAQLLGGNKARSKESMLESNRRLGRHVASGAGYGGHFRAVQGFRYLGESECKS